MQSCLSKLLLFGKMNFGDERRIAAEMYERSVVAGEILIKEGDTGLSRVLPSFIGPDANVNSCMPSANGMLHAKKAELVCTVHTIAERACIAQTTYCESAVRQDDNTMFAYISSPFQALPA